MSPDAQILLEVIGTLAWPVVALAALGCAIGVLYRWRHPFMSGERLDAVETRLADVSDRVQRLSLAQWGEDQRKPRRATP